MIASALTEGNLKITNIKPKIIKTEIDVLRKVGASIKIKGTELRIIGKNKINNVKIVTSPYPGFPTDLQAQLMAVMTISNGTSIITENIFENRFMHAPELMRMGAKIKLKGNLAVIEGVKSLKGAEVMATDLRASVSLVLAGLAANGKTNIDRVYHIDRGYQDIVTKLKLCGANINRVVI